MAQINAKYTAGKIWNSTTEPITLFGKYIYDGTHDSDFPEEIQDGTNEEFKHEAITDDENPCKTSGSIAALVYKGRDDGTKWVVAWSNPVGSDSKVYTDIYKQTVHWDQIKHDLDTKGKAKFHVVKHGYKADIEIDPKARSPTLKATLKYNMI